MLSILSTSFAEVDSVLLVRLVKFTPTRFSKKMVYVAQLISRSFVLFHVSWFPVSRIVLIVPAVNFWSQKSRYLLRIDPELRRYQVQRDGLEMLIVDYSQSSALIAHKKGIGRASGVGELYWLTDDQ